MVLFISIYASLFSPNTVLSTICVNSVRTFISTLVFALKRFAIIDLIEKKNNFVRFAFNTLVRLQVAKSIIQ